jgi:threonine synthase
MEYEIKCTICHKPSSNLLDCKCPSCEQPLEIHQSRRFNEKQIHTRDYSAWRYASFFPYVKETDIVTLGEGLTPLVKFKENLRLKLENLNPTGSFKDRGSTTLISALHRLIKEKNGHISEDSSGNAGASIAAYSARAGLKAKIYVPEAVSGPKFSQIQFYGANVVKVSGSRTKVAEEAQETTKNSFYIGHILHPLFRDGIRTLAYEIVEQSDWQIPEKIFLPASAGTLLLGVLAGFNHLLESSIIDAMPTIIACQTSQVSPLYHRFKNLAYRPPEQITSIADALVSTNPPLLELMAKQLKTAKGSVAMVDEDEVNRAFRELAHCGFFVEPSSAVAYAAYAKQIERKEASSKDRTVIILTGSGLKTILKPN